MTDKTDKRARNEFLKEESHFLRGTIADGLAHVETGAISDDDTQLIKFHGSYMQDDRDIRGERAKKKLEKAFSFMIRLRLPGGLVSPEQWIKLDDIAGTYANGSLRLTTRATFQYHGVIKSNLRRTMQAINGACLDTIAACGDVNRNVMCVANPFFSPVHAAAGEFARKVSDHLLPKTSAYHEIWLEGDKVEDMSRPAVVDTEPLYGTHYLPRKFKIVIAVPPHNDGDVFAHDLGYIAITNAKGELAGWNVSIGGGMGMTHGDTATFPRTGDVIGFCTPEQAVDVAEKVMLVQRDWGNRENRANARLKYTVERFGVDKYREEVESRLGYKLGEARPFKFTSMGDPIGWYQGPDKKWHLGLFIEAGRIRDFPGRHLRTAIREIAEAGGITFSVTGNQNIIICNASAKQKTRIDAILKSHGIDIATSSGLRRNSISCVALPTCALALAESERFLPELITTLEDSLDKAGLRNDDIVIRMTGCPNGCGRPYMAEIGFVGRSPGLYNLYLGAAHEGTRLNKLYAQDVGKARIVELLEPLFVRYAKERDEGESFGDFVIRAGVVKPTLGGNTFHDDIALV
ncbi:sulfite reductase [Hyphomicrobium nitrativorans NL23]|uniref:Sulfite reductase [NADPH] hemoprotein beta-component n=1 Tax=Hyphomicrobium nitrativorans NL23 TaxID=1029756 RepID=V5SGQ2_9HYPH|nr:NADPH-dependent assimilatory sulfite reductase hemoprotein subunit [Hyphomicrobium nitrativorans]AHB49134.1 sulfite reductase [Hyphomicrobium nitrativorans NL23]